MINISLTTEEAAILLRALSHSYRHDAKADAKDRETMTRIAAQVTLTSTTLADKILGHE